MFQVGDSDLQSQCDELDSRGLHHFSNRLIGKTVNRQGSHSRVQFSF